MSDDMSMFKKMRDKITDEVNSATNKLQNMQIMDQLASSIGQQTPKNHAMPQQTLPGLPEHTDAEANSHFNLAFDHSNSHEEEELNSEISPQHQLFNEQMISRLKPSNGQNSARDKKKSGRGTSSRPLSDKNLHSVIDIDHLNSDIEEGLGDSVMGDDVEVDLLSEKEIPPASGNVASQNHLDAYRARYRELVYALRKLNHDHRAERSQLLFQTSDLRDQIIALDRELNVLKQQRESNSSQAHGHDGERNQSNRQFSKIKDLEKLMAKCKESLKAKNTQLKILKDSLNEVDKFRDYIDDIKKELKELKNAHETWTLSIAENKRIMHQEIENKNSEMDKLRQDINDMQSQLKESNNRCNQLKTSLQNLESRLVSTSAAHQKERDSLTKQLTANKNTAIKQLQKEHELETERIKLDLERSIEALKTEILTKDELIIRSAEKQNELQRQNCSLTTDLESAKRTCIDTENELKTLKSQDELHIKEIQGLKSQLDAIKGQDSINEDLKRKNDDLKQCKKDLSDQIEGLTNQIDALKAENEQCQQKLRELEAETKKPSIPETCSQCQDYQERISKGAEQYEQSLFELNAKLELMTTANADQEKAIKSLSGEHESSLGLIKSLRSDSEELVKKNASLLQVIQDNESEMQSQQDQLDKLKTVKQQLDNLKKDHAALNASLTQVKSELKERNADLSKSNKVIEDLKKRLSELELAHKDSSQDLESVKKERDALVLNLETEFRKKKEVDEQLVVNILAALKNLETPDTSPGSDKIYSPGQQDAGDSNQEPSLPDPVKLAENLSSLALDRSTAYMTSNQRLQAVLLDNTMISEEVSRLKEELSALSHEKAKEIMSSLDEVERLRTENQALIHDQKAYDDQMMQLETEIESLKQQLADLTSRQQQQCTIDASTGTSDIDESPTLQLKVELEAKEREIEKLRKVVVDKDEENKSLQMAELKDVPSSTEFEYLKNIVFQFLMGREPITLARVISAIFKFDQEQIDQICKVQEVIHQVSS